jgi:hypothetical protein
MTIEIVDRIGMWAGALMVLWIVARIVLAAVLDE